MKHLAVALAVGVMLFGASPPTLAQGTFPLEYKMIKGFSYDDSLASMASQYVSRSPGKPADIKAGPKDVQGEVAYYVTSLGNKQLVVAMDSANPPNMFIDRNGDGDLSDEKPLKRTKATMPWGGGEGGLYGPASITFGKDGAASRILASRREDDLVMVWPAGYLTGQIKVGEKTLKVALLDANYDGRIESTADAISLMRGRGASDMLGLDLNGDGKFAYDPYQGGEIQPLTAMVSLAGGYYQMKMDNDGSGVELVKAEPKLGKLAVKGANVELLVMGAGGQQYLKSAKDGWDLPVGRYVCQTINLVTTDEKKSKWQLQAMGRTGDLQSFEVKPDKPVTVELGAPLTVKADVQQQGSGWIFKGTEVSVGFVIAGKGGEEYSPAATKDGAQVPAPKITIYDKDGKVLASGSFAYG